MRVANKISYAIAGILLLLFTFKTQAQSLGDPILHITFGSGSNLFGGALPADSGSTTYSYVAGSPPDGSYTITSTSANMHPTTWWTTSDHSGDPHGYMMLVNASTDPGIFYTRKVSGLCGSTQYQFAAFIKNLINNANGIKPNVTFSIETMQGQVLALSPANGGTGDIPVANQWVQYPFIFTTPANVNDVVLKMTNNAPGGNGNDLVIDDITFSPYGSPVTAVFNPNSTSQTFCAGTSHPLIINTTSTLAGGYQQKLQLFNNGAWIDQSAAGTATSYAIQTPVAAGNYSYRLVSASAAT